MQECLMIIQINTYIHRNVFFSYFVIHSKQLVNS